MLTSDEQAEWARLCEEADAARDAYFKAANTYRSPSTDEEWAAVHAAESHWDEAISRMKEFLKQHLAD